MPLYDFGFFLLYQTVLSVMKYSDSSWELTRADGSLNYKDSIVLDGKSFLYSCWNSVMKSNKTKVCNEEQKFFLFDLVVNGIFKRVIIRSL